jgi:hypothetical protein
MIGIMIALVVHALTGCTPPAEGPDVQSVPLVTADAAKVTGEIELEVEGRAIVFGLSGEVLAGDATGVVLRRADLDIDLDGTANGRPAGVAIELRNSLSGEWTHCLASEMEALGWVAKLRYPLSESCGPAGLLELAMRPFPGIAQPPAPVDSN